MNSLAELEHRKRRLEQELSELENDYDEALHTVASFETNIDEVEAELEELEQEILAFGTSYTAKLNAHLDSKDPDQCVIF